MRWVGGCEVVLGSRNVSDTVQWSVLALPSSSLRFLLQEFLVCSCAGHLFGTSPDKEQKTRRSVYLTIRPLRNMR
jgi:hypothetical protein